MTEIDPAAFASDAALEESIRPLVNEILERFNQEAFAGGSAGPGDRVDRSASYPRCAAI